MGPRDTWLPANKTAVGVVLLTHGLNLHPERMDDLGQAFAAAGYEVFRPAFAGHAAENDELLHVRSEQWESDARRFYAIVSKRAREHKVPLILCAYSFSALIYQVLSEELPFDRRIYFAPALKTHFWYSAAIKFVNLFPDLKYRSKIPDGYYANARSSLRSAHALHQFVRRWRAKRGVVDSIPTLIWASLKDELVHGKRLRKLAKSRKGWEFRELSVEGGTLPKRYHHLVIDRASLGSREFRRVVGETEKFLKNGL